MNPAFTVQSNPVYATEDFGSLSPITISHVKTPEAHFILGRRMLQPAPPRGNPHPEASLLVEELKALEKRKREITARLVEISRKHQIDIAVNVVK